MTVEEFLTDNGIHFTIHEHRAVFTVEEVEQYAGNSGLACKNLFMRNGKGDKHFLFVTPANQPVDLKRFGASVGERMSFASPERLQKWLGLTPGSVSPFGLINDEKAAVQVYIDQKVYTADRVSFHPNRNTASLVLSKEMFHKYLSLLPHEVNVVESGEG